MPKTKKVSTPKKVTKKETKKEEVKDTKYNVEISVNDVVFKTKADSIEEALTNFIDSPEFPHGAKTKLFIKYSKGKETRSRFWHTGIARRLLMTLAIKPSAVNVIAEQLNRGINE